MAAMGVDCHAMPRWLTTPLAASAASFPPSKAAIATGCSSGPSTSLNLMTSPPPDHRGLVPLTTAYVAPYPEFVTCGSHSFWGISFVSDHNRGSTQEAYERACDHTSYRTGRRAAPGPHRAGRRGGWRDGHDAAGQRGYASGLPRSRGL